MNCKHCGAPMNEGDLVCAACQKPAALEFSLETIEGPAPAAAPEASDPAADEELPFADPADRGVSAASSVNEDYEKLLKMLTETK